MTDIKWFIFSLVHPSFFFFFFSLHIRLISIVSILRQHPMQQFVRVYVIWPLKLVREKKKKRKFSCWSIEGEKKGTSFCCVPWLLNPPSLSSFLPTIIHHRREEKETKWYDTRAGTRTRTLRMTRFIRNVGVRCLNPLGHAGFFFSTDFPSISYRFYNHMQLIHHRQSLNLLLSIVQSKFIRNKSIEFILEIIDENVMMNHRFPSIIKRNLSLVILSKENLMRNFKIYSK